LQDDAQKYEITYVTSAGAPGRIGLTKAKEIFRKEFGIVLAGVEIHEGEFIHNGTGNGHETIVLRATRWEPVQEVSHEGVGIDNRHVSI